ncbi:MAG: S24 family peptidase [Bacteroidota bacterium]
MPTERPPLDPRRFATAVGTALARHDRSQADLARAAEVAPSSVSRYLAGTLTPSRDVAQRILDELGLDWDDVAYASAPPRISEPSSTADVVLVPRDGYASGARSLEEGYVNGSLPTAYDDEDLFDPYPRAEMARMTGMNPDLFRSCSIIGDSLVPEIPPNSRVVYFPIAGYEGDGLYILRIDDAHLVKRVQQFADGTLRLIPFNPAYEPETLTPVREADTDHTYRSTTTGGTSVIRFVGKVVYYPKAA